MAKEKTPAFLTGKRKDIPWEQPFVSEWYERNQVRTDNAEMTALIAIILACIALCVSAATILLMLIL